MATPDPSGFYMALAQTSAAVVGLFGAVLGSHIIEHLDTMRDERRDLLERINTVYRHFQERIQHWGAYKEYLERKILRENAIFETGSSFLGGLKEMTWEGTVSITEAETHDHLRTDSEEDLKLLLQLMPAYTLFTGEVRKREVSHCAARLRDCSESLPSDSKAAHLVAVDAGLLEKLSHRLARFRARLFPRSFLVVLIVLAWLSITGIVWPLSAIPGFDSVPTQRIMLLALGVGLLTLIGFFVYQFLVLARLGKIYWVRPH